jgi:outer membrane protein assembly factor BamB
MFARSLILGLTLLVGVAQAENWPQWRGAKLDGMSSETGLATEWSKDKNIAWRLPLPGPAGSTPVVWDDRIFLTTVNDDMLELHCVSTAGKTLWKQVVGKGNKDVRGDEGNSAAPSPATDGKHVWTFMANGLLACYTVEGEKVWGFDVGERFGKLKIAFGMTSTPVLDGDRLYLQLIHGEGDPTTREAVVVALDKSTGDTVWVHERKSDGIKECEHSYASPMLYRDNERAYLLSHGADYIVAHDLGDGSEIWRCGGLNLKSNYNPTLRFVASPLAIPGMIVVPSAKNGPVLSIDPAAQGDVTNSKSAIRWTREHNTPDVSSPLVVDGLLYLCRENGNLICMDAQTGEEHYEQRTTRDRHRASPVFADGKIYLTARKGVVTVVNPGVKFKILAQNDLGEPTSASPAISGGTIYIRTFDALYAIREQ